MINNDLQVVLFKLGTEEFGVNIIDIREIIKPIEVTHLPETESWLEGVISLRDIVIPIVDLRKYLDISFNKTEQEKIILTQIDGELVGFKVDSVEGITYIQNDELDSPPKIAKQNYIQKIAIQKNKKMILVLSLEELLKSDKAKDLQQVVSEINQKKL
ncbi:MAG: chemotaxis protein CheW [bacterium]